MKDEKRITLRLPAQMHERIVQTAKKEHRSLNAEIIALLEQILDCRDSRRHSEHQMSDQSSTAYP